MIGCKDIRESCPSSPIWLYLLGTRMSPIPSVCRGGEEQVLVRPKIRIRMRRLNSIENPIEAKQDAFGDNGAALEGSQSGQPLLAHSDSSATDPDRGKKTIKERPRRARQRVVRYSPELPAARCSENREESGCWEPERPPSGQHAAQDIGNQSQDFLGSSLQVQRGQIEVGCLSQILQNTGCK